MKIGGLQPVTLMDYPQKVAAIIFTSGCNMRCSFCYNPFLVLPELVAESPGMPVAKALDYLRERKKYLDGVAISGGEPLIQGDLPDFLRQVKSLGYSVKLDTNGLLPDVLSQLIGERLVDYLAMDIKGPLNRYGELSGVVIDPVAILNSIDLVKKSGGPYEFRSTLVKGLHRREDIEEMARLIAGAEKYYLQNFQPLKRLVAAEFSGRSFLPSEMEDFQAVAGRYVTSCLIR